MSNVVRYDVINVPQAQIDANGWIRDKPILTRTGIFIYRDANGKTTREYRSPEEVFKADSLATLVGIPITDKHVGIKTADNVDGILGTVIGPGEQSGANVVADLIIHNPKRLGNRRELSLGYRAIVNDRAGITPGGEHYDTVQTDIVYNHLAVVEKGRAGNARLRLDGTDAASGDFVTEEELMADGPKMVMVKIDEIEYAAAQEVARAIVKLKEEADQRASGYDSLQAERDSLKGQVAEATQILANAIMDGKDDKRGLVDLSKLLVDQSASAGDKVRSRIILEERAKKHAVVFDDKTTDRKLKEDIATKLTPSIKFDGKSDDYVNSAFDIAIEMNAGKDSKIGDMRAKVVPKTEKTFTGGASAARAKMVENIRIGRGA